MSDLKELDFTDMYIPLDEETESRARYIPRIIKPGHSPNLTVPDNFEDDISILRKQIKQKNEQYFTLNYSGMRFRISTSYMGFEPWCSVRRFPLAPPPVKKLGFHPKDIAAMMQWGRRPSGLVLIGGATGAGKTTTGSVILSEWAKNNGHVGFTIEDPIEYDLSGEHYVTDDNGKILQNEGKGNFIFQNEVSTPEEWRETGRLALRWRPRYIFIGEVRTQEAAEIILNCSTSGHVVIGTIHASSIEDTVSAIIQNATQGMNAMSVEQAYHRLANGLTSLIYQSQREGDIHPTISMLQTAPLGHKCEIRNIIRTAATTSPEQRGNQLKELHNIAVKQNADRRK